VVGQKSARALYLTRKLNFLKKIWANGTSESLSTQTLASLTDDVNSTCLVQECRDLEQYFRTAFAEAILIQDTDPCPHSRDIKNIIAARDLDLLLTQHEGRADMSIVVEVVRAIGWPRLWDLALNNGAKHVEGLRNLVRVIAFPSHGDRLPIPCHAPCVRGMRSAETPCSAMSSTATPTAASAALNSSKTCY